MAADRQSQASFSVALTNSSAWRAQLLGEGEADEFVAFLIHTVNLKKNPNLKMIEPKYLNS